jgi:hypothetical protein
MNFPGFTAESSIYPTFEHFWTKQRQISAKQQVIPQQASSLLGAPIGGTIGVAPIEAAPTGGGGRSCSSGNGQVDCFCSGGCCRNQTSCWCC